MDERLSRRALLLRAGALGSVGALAGCASEPPGATTDGPSGAASTGRPTTAVTVPDPTGVLITRWRRDPFARGSYSYLAVGADSGDRSSIAEPVDGRLFFAGEATHRVFPATVHGALLSGRRAAGQVVASGARSVVVVGAGAAGLGAAEQLHRDGLDVRMVEGRDRIGGRVWTDDSLGTPLDLGASWIHGVQGNPLTAIADGAGIERVATDYGNAVVRAPGGVVVDDDEVPAEFRIVTEVEQELAADVGDLSPAALDEGDIGGGGDVVFPSGYLAVLETLSTGYPIDLGTTVRSIDHGGEAVVVTTSSGTLETDAVVITVPLGVLKSGSIEFVPALPAPKLAAIDRLGMGLLDKVYLRFPEVFWDADVEFLGHVGADRDRFVSWVNVATYTGAPILMAFNAGSAAEAIERQDDSQIVAEAVAALRRMYGAA